MTKRRLNLFVSVSQSSRTAVLLQLVIFMLPVNHNPGIVMEILRFLVIRVAVGWLSRRHRGNARP